MAQLDLSEHRRRLFALGAELSESDAPRVRLAYRGRRLAPVGGLAREWLVDVLLPTPPPVVEEAVPIEPAEAADEPEQVDSTDPDAPTDVLEVASTAEDEPAAAVEPELAPAAAAVIDALALQMWLVDVLAARDFRLERLGVDDANDLERVSLALIGLEERMSELFATEAVPAVIRDGVRKLGRELSALATFTEVTLGNVSIGLESDAARLEPGEAPAPLDLGELARPRAERPASPPPRAAAAGPAENVRLGRLKVRFSAKEVRLLKIVAFALMPVVIAAVVALQLTRDVSPAGPGAEARRILASVDGKAVGKAYVVRLASFTDFDTDRKALLDLTKAIAEAGYESARFEYGGKAVAVWEGGYLRASP
ncbi:MAG: hypothetical protein IPK07_30020 [Deltaproteobacteria bacterium]|nr:hypothetical protein [Deltaproteobacteria bacterium]